MNSPSLRRGLLVVGLLAAGAALAYLRPDSSVEAQTPFRQLLWEGRRSDLAIQLGLMLVGAFGIRALLPSSTDDEDEADERLD